MGACCESKPYGKPCGDCAFDEPGGGGLPGLAVLGRSEEPVAEGIDACGGGSGCEAHSRKPDDLLSSAMMRSLEWAATVAIDEPDDHWRTFTFGRELSSALMNNGVPTAFQVMAWADETTGCKGVLCRLGPDPDPHYNLHYHIFREPQTEGWLGRLENCSCVSSLGQVDGLCIETIECEGDGCPFKTRSYHWPCPSMPKKLWWADLTPCPPTMAEAETQRKPGRRGGVGPRIFCNEGKNKFHPGAKACFREIATDLNKPGQQCCYKDDGTLATEGAMAGTPDMYSTAYGITTNGDCMSDGVQALVAHGPADVVPFTALVAAGRSRGMSERAAMERAARKYHETHPPWGSREAERQMANWHQQAARGALGPR